jgi:glycosyltransferase involved in cell wall biosynthesis
MSSPLSAPPRAATIHVASVPASHVYVRHLADPAGDDDVVRLPDVAPPDGELVPGGWWPPAMLDPAWVQDNHEQFDVFHVHFGFDAIPVERLAAAIDALDAHDIPLVYTVHDLRNPHQRSPHDHDARVALLASRAARLITLTPGAAEVLRSRYGREADVLPHPHVLPASRLGAPRTRHDGFVVGVHAKSLRANMDVLAVARTLAVALESLPDARLRINLHDEVSDRDSWAYDPRTVARLRALAARHPLVDLIEHPYFSDDALWDYLASLDMSVLPYRFGTHSGWLEACHDLGTAVVAPSCGFYAQQRPCLSYRHDEDGFDPASLIEAVLAAYAAGPIAPADPVARLEERHEVAAAHAALYREVLRR